MKLLLFPFLVFCALSVLSQSKKYIVIQDIAPFKTVSVGSFNLRINKINLTHKTLSNRSCDIFNLYFSKKNFHPVGLDERGLTLGVNDYNKLNNDILITFVPLTDSLSFKLTKLSDEQLKNMSIVKYDQLIQKAVSNLYKSFVKYEISYTGDKTYVIQTKQYGLIIQRGNDYFRLDAPVLTLNYLIDEANYISAAQYHIGEINTALSSRTQYYNLKEIDYLYSKFSDADAIKNSLFYKTLPEKVDSTEELYMIKYNSMPVNGIGSFYFSTGIGIVNGAFDYSSDNISKENFNPDNFSFRPKTINGLTIRNFIQTMNKKYPPVIKYEL